MSVELILKSLTVCPDFQQIEVDLLTSEAGVRKIQQQFSKTPFKFKFIIDSMGGSIRFMRDRAPAYMQEHGADDVILIGYSQNITSKVNYRPMNAWTLAHRMGHVAQVNMSSLPDTAQYDVFAPFGELANVFTSGGVQLNGMGPAWQSAFPELGPINDLVRFLMTQKSARENRISSELDLLGELIAQFVITGSVKFLKPDGWDARFELLKNPSPVATDYATANVKKMGGQVFAGMQKERELYGDALVYNRIKVAEQKVNVAIENLLLAMHGKCLTF